MISRLELLLQEEMCGHMCINIKKIFIRLKVVFKADTQF